MRLADVLDDVRHARPEAAFTTWKAEELGNLRAGEHEGNAALESDQHRLGDEVDDGAGLGGPRDDGHHADEQRQAHGERRKPLRIAAGPPSEVPTRSEMAEVAATAVCRELQNTQYTSPPNRQA